jgi:hypothetical protein
MKLEIPTLIDILITRRNDPHAEIEEARILDLWLVEKLMNMFGTNGMTLPG